MYPHCGYVVQPFFYSINYINNLRKRKDTIMDSNGMQRNDASAHAGQLPSGQDHDALVSDNDDELSGVGEPEVDEVDLLRQQLDKANATLVETQRSAAEAEGKFTVLEKQYGQLQGVIADTIKSQGQPKGQKKPRRRIGKLPDILDDAGEFRSAIQQELDEVYGRLEEIPQNTDPQLKEEVSSLNSAVQDITKALQALSQNQLYNDEQNQLVGMGYSHQEIQRLETTRAREGLPTLRSALGYEPDLMVKSQSAPSRRARKRARSANKQTPANGNGNGNNGQTNTNGHNTTHPNAGAYQPNVATLDQRVDPYAFGNEINNHEQNPNLGNSAPGHDGNAREEIRQHLAAGTYATLPPQERRRLQIAAQKAAAADSWDSAY